MQLRNTPHRYGIISIGLHWIFALAVYAMFGLGLWMVTLSYYDGWYHQAPELHKSIGVLLMMGLVVRVVWRHISPPPPAPKTHGKFTRVSAVAAHIALYALLFAIVWTEVVLVVWLAWSVVILSVLHGLAALKHHVIDKDDTLKRMLGRSSSDSGA